MDVKEKLKTHADKLVIGTLCALVIIIGAFAVQAYASTQTAAVTKVCVTCETTTGLPATPVCKDYTSFTDGTAVDLLSATDFPGLVMTPGKECTVTVESSTAGKVSHFFRLGYS